MASIHLGKHEYPCTADAKEKISISHGYQAIVLHCLPALYFLSNSMFSFQLWALAMETTISQSEGIGKLI